MSKKDDLIIFEAILKQFKIGETQITIHIPTFHKEMGIGEDEMEIEHSIFVLMRNYNNADKSFYCLNRNIPSTLS